MRARPPEPTARPFARVDRRCAGRTRVLSQQVTVHDCFRVTRGGGWTLGVAILQRDGNAPLLSIAHFFEGQIRHRAEISLEMLPDLELAIALCRQLAQGAT